MTDVSLETMERCEVVSVGSANMDMVVRTQRFPEPGETIHGLSFQMFAGGKGANQAVAAGKLGAVTRLLAKVGQDSSGDELVRSLNESGVETRSVLRHPTESTGVAMITLDSSGQNTIVVAQGTNALLNPTDVSECLTRLDFKVMLVQLEIPMESVVSAAQFCEERTFILNPAPAAEVPAEVLCKVDFLTPNETEAHALTGVLPDDDASCIAASRVLLDKGVKNVLITLGERGSFLANHSGGRHFPSIQVTPIDTTGAGDAFNGAFARFLSRGDEVERAVELANVAGALSTMKLGAQASMATLAEVMARSENR